MKIKFAISELKQRFLCIPLRYVLLTWAYLKLVSDLVALPTIILCCGPMTYDNIMPATPVMIDFLFTLTYIILTHKNKPEGARIYFYYMVVVLILSVYNLCREIMGISVQFYLVGAIPLTYIIEYVPLTAGFWEYIIFYIINLLLQACWILLLRREANKLRKSANHEDNSPDTKQSIQNPV